MDYWLVQHLSTCSDSEHVYNLTNVQLNSVSPHTHKHSVSEQQLRWAKTEDNPLFLCLFGRLAELSWMGNELIRQYQDKVCLYNPYRSHDVYRKSLVGPYSRFFLSLPVANGAEPGVQRH